MSTTSNPITPIRAIAMILAHAAMRAKKSGSQDARKEGLNSMPPKSEGVRALRALSLGALHFVGARNSRGSDGFFGGTATEA